MWGVVASYACEALLFAVILVLSFGLGAHTIDCEIFPNFEWGCVLRYIEGMGAWR